MTPAAHWIFALAVAGVLYPYAVYPLLLVLVAALRPRRGPPADPERWPTVSVLLPARNEEATIAATLERVLAADYPRDRRQIVVVSDASTDRTDQIVRSFADRGVELLRLDQRGGKTAAENAAREHLHGEIVVNTDASVHLDARGLKELVRPFSDPAVGLTSGRDVSVVVRARDSNVGESGYVGYEMWVRDLETRIGTIVGASGCFYAIRKRLHMVLVPEALSRDFAAALVAHEFGMRAVSVPQALCYVPRVRSVRREYPRKVRTMTRGLETLWFKRHLMNPFRHGLFAWLLWSHKLARWLVPWAFAAGGLSLLALAPSETWAVVVLLAGIAALGVAAIGWWWPENKAAPLVPALLAYVISGLFAALVAWIKALSGELNPVWEPTRRHDLNLQI